MVKVVEEYKEYEIYRYYSGDRPCYYASHKTGQYPTVVRGTKCSNRRTVRRRIDEFLTEAPVEESTYEAPADAPKEVDVYRGIPIIYHPNRNQYYAKVAEHGKYCDSLDEAHAFIDKQLYQDSPAYTQAKADEKAKQDALAMRASVYGIGVDDEGNEIPPTEAQIERMDDYYAKQRLITGTDIREEYEIEEGITVAEEEQVRRDEALIEEAEEQGLPGNIYLIGLLEELRKLYWVSVNIVRSVTG